MPAMRASHQDLVLLARCHSTLSREMKRPAQRNTGFAASTIGVGVLGASPGRAMGDVGVTLFGFTSVLPTKVTPSSMTSFEARMSPNSSVLALISIFSLALILPVILPRTTTDCALIL